MAYCLICVVRLSKRRLKLRGKIGAAVLSEISVFSRKLFEIVLKFSVPVTGKWAVSDNVLVTLGAGNTPDCNTIFDDFKVDEK